METQNSLFCEWKQRNQAETGQWEMAARFAVGNDEVEQTRRTVGKGTELKEAALNCGNTRQNMYPNVWKSLINYYLITS